MAYDVVIIGAGLSGSEVLIQLVNTLSKNGCIEDIKIALIEKHNEIGTGLPYGNRSDSRNFIIEDMHSSTTLEFKTWLKSLINNDLLMTGLDEEIKNWLIKHKNFIVGNNFINLYCPRQLLGIFQKMRLKKTIKNIELKESFSLNVLKDEAISMAFLSDFSYEIALKGGAKIKAKHVVLAIGALPRKSSNKFNDNVMYLDNNYVNEFKDVLKSVALKYKENGPVDIIIKGGNASALELIYLFESESSYRAMVNKFISISRRGYILPGNISSNSNFLVEEDFFPSSPKYIDTAWSAVEGKRLILIKGEVNDKNLSYKEKQFHISLENGNGKVSADIIVDCSGAGTMEQNSSDLIKSITLLNDSPRLTSKGFKMNEKSFELESLKRVFVLGPLLNGDTADSYIESNKRIYELAPKVALLILDSMNSKAESASSFDLVWT